MSLKPSRRSLHAVPKVKLGELQPLPEPVEEMAVEAEEMLVSSYQENQLETCMAVNMLSALRLDGVASWNSTPPLSRDGSFDDVFICDSADDGDQGRSWQLSGDTGSSGFGNSVTSFMSWTDDVEVETTKKVQELFDELERCFYGEQSLDKLKKEVAEECFDWRSKFPHYRVRGTGLELSSFRLQALYKKTCADDKMTVDEAACVVREGDGDSDEEEEEVIASHGSYQEEQELNDCCNRNVNSKPPESSDVVCCVRDLSAESLQQKVKDSVMEQLFSHVWSEVSEGLEALLHLYPDSTLQQRHINPLSVQGQSTMNNPRLPDVDTTFRAFTPISDNHSSELDGTLCVSAKPTCHSARSTLVSPVLESNLEIARTRLKVGPVQQTSVAPTISLPKPLSLHSANHVLAPMPVLERRGYHSAADRRTRAVLNRRFTSVTSGHERFLQPLEEQQTVVAKVTTTPRQVSAPTFPPNWSRHVMLPSINHLDPHLKLQGSSSLYEPNVRSTEVSPRSRTSAKQKGTGLSKIGFAKQLLEIHEDPSPEKKNGLMSSAKNRRCKQKLKGHSHMN